MDEILDVLGARGDVASYGKIYLWYMFGATIIQLSGSVFVPYERNNGGVTYATYFMVIGFIMNSVLDYVLIMIFPFGIHGAAIATLLSQAVTIVGCIYYVKKHQMLKLSKPVNVQKTSLKIMKIGIAPFGINMSPMVSIFLWTLFTLLWRSFSGINHFLYWIHTLLCILRSSRRRCSAFDE